jgi:hypothetical protein
MCVPKNMVSVGIPSDDPVFHRVDATVGVLLSDEGSNTG